MIKGEDSGQATDEAKPEDKEESASKTAIDIKNGHVPKQEAVATIGGGGKRRLAKAVGLEENEPEKRELKSDLKGVKATKRDKKAKKTKKVKLSFDDE